MLSREELVLTEEKELKATCQKVPVHLLWVVCLWAGLLACLCLSFCICTMGLVAPGSGGTIEKTEKVLHKVKARMTLAHDGGSVTKSGLSTQH